MTHRTILIGALLTLAACSGTAASLASTSTVEGPSPATTEGLTQAPVFETTIVPAPSQFETALDTTIAAGSYEFGGQLIAHVGSSSVTTGLHGWVDGTSQLIVTEATSGVVETLVVDGIATVTQNGSTSTVDLGAVEGAPSFELLKAIDIQEETPGIVKGTVPATSANGEAASGVLNVTVWYSTTISAFEISEPNGAWELSMTFSNVGTFDSTATP
jgi:hypothetical protein